MNSVNKYISPSYIFCRKGPATPDTPYISHPILLKGFTLTIIFVAYISFSSRSSLPGHGTLSRVYFQILSLFPLGHTPFLCLLFHSGPPRNGRWSIMARTTFSFLRNLYTDFRNGFATFHSQRGSQMLNIEYFQINTLVGKQISNQ